MGGTRPGRGFALAGTFWVYIYIYIREFALHCVVRACSAGISPGMRLEFATASAHCHGGTYIFILSFAPIIFNDETRTYLAQPHCSLRALSSSSRELIISLMSLSTSSAPRPFQRRLKEFVIVTCVIFINPSSNSPA